MPLAVQSTASHDLTAASPPHNLIPSEQPLEDMFVTKHELRGALMKNEERVSQAR
jgi:hypothetical protein